MTSFKTKLPNETLLTLASGALYKAGCLLLSLHLFLLFAHYIPDILAILGSFQYTQLILSGLLQSDLLAGPSLSLRKAHLSLSLSSPGSLPSFSFHSSPSRYMREIPTGFPEANLGEYFLLSSLLSPNTCYTYGGTYRCVESRGDLPRFSQMKNLHFTV